MSIAMIPRRSRFTHGACKTPKSSHESREGTNAAEISALDLDYDDIQVIEYTCGHVTSTYEYVVHDFKATPRLGLPRGPEYLRMTCLSPQMCFCGVGSANSRLGINA